MLEITSLGATVRYAFETTAGTRPTSGYSVLPDVNQAPEQDLSIATIDVSNIRDNVTRYAPGRQDPGGDQAFTLNHTDAVISEWDTLVATAEAKRAENKRLWFEYKFPGATYSYYWAGTPQQLGTSGISQNELDTIPAHVVLTDWAGWQPASTVMSSNKSTLALTVGTNGTATLSNASGAVVCSTSNSAVATAAESSGTVTVTPVAAGSAIITCTDGNGDSVKIVCTVSAT